MRLLLPAGSGRHKEVIPQRLTVDQVEGHSRTTRVWDFFLVGTTFPLRDKPFVARDTRTSSNLH
jgi:hypothetical protein